MAVREYPTVPELACLARFQGWLSSGQFANGAKFWLQWRV